MKKNKYDKPEIEIVELDTENVIATSFDSKGMEETSTDGGAYSRKRGFWGDQE